MGSFVISIGKKPKLRNSNFIHRKYWNVNFIFSVSKIWARNEAFFSTYYVLVGTIWTFHRNEIRTTAATTHSVWSFIAKPKLKPESVEAKTLQLTSKEAAVCMTLHWINEKYGTWVWFLHLLKPKFRANARDSWSPSKGKWSIFTVIGCSGGEELLCLPSFSLTDLQHITEWKGMTWTWGWGRMSKAVQSTIYRTLPKGEQWGLHLQVLKQILPNRALELTKDWIILWGRGQD